jgi:mRNA interferase RelE/StbE
MIPRLDDPACGKALKEELDGLRSYRFKRFRIIYRIGSRSIDILAIGPRRSIYEETFRIISREEF